MLGAKAGAISWSFPGTAVHLPCALLNDSNFIESLATFLEQASVESTKKLSEYAVKAGAEVWENRETPDPSLITSLLAAILEANGTRIAPTLLHKRVRDEVLWSNAHAPWRRLPCWLVLRVSISRYLAIILGDGQAARIQYKAFMCLVHAKLLEGIKMAGDLHALEFLKAKLCRRLFKLDRDHAELSHTGQASFDTLLNTLTPRMNKVIQEARARIETVWGEEKLRTKKSILPLPSQATEQDLRLTLAASRQYLLNAQTRFQGFRRRNQMYGVNSIAYTPEEHIHDSARTYFAMFDLEDEISLKCSGPISGEVNLTERCLNLHSTLLEYVKGVGTFYDGNKEQKSLMLLLVMEVWVALDQAACTMFPLMLDFHPMLHPHLMEVLHFSSLSDVARARKVQGYLETREEKCQDKHVTVFDDPVKGCFAERYFDESADAEALAELLYKIQEVADEERRSKEREWTKLSLEYEALTKEINSTTCLYTSSFDGFHPPRHDSRDCLKCELTQRQERIKIRIFESPLPESDTLAKVVVFELRCPRAFSAYRDATWAILYRLANDNQEDALKPRVCLNEYSELQPYRQIHGALSLASTAKSCKEYFIRR